MSRAPSFGGARPRRLREGGQQRRGDGRLEVPLGKPGQAVLEGDRLALLGQLEPALDRAGRLREHRGVCRSSAPAGRAAAAVEDRQLGVALGRKGDELLLGAIDLPVARRGSRRPWLSRSIRPSPRAAAVGSRPAARRRGRARRVGRRSSRAAAPRERSGPPRARESRAASTSPAVAVIETITRSIARGPWRSRASAAAANAATMCSARSLTSLA